MGQMFPNRMCPLSTGVVGSMFDQDLGETATRVDARCIATLVQETYIVRGDVVDGFETPWCNDFAITNHA